MLFHSASFIAHNDPRRDAITQAYHQDEAACIETLWQYIDRSKHPTNLIRSRARQLITDLRDQQHKQKVIISIENFLSHYQLSSQQGLAVMCLAEALLRIPDKKTIHELISDKLSHLQWQTVLDESSSVWIRLSSWGLMLSARLFQNDLREQLSMKDALDQACKSIGQPLFRHAISQAMKILSHQFVMGENITQALKRSQKMVAQGYRYSYDMLGEAARTERDAENYFKAYREAIIAVGQVPISQTASIFSRPSVSVKLSALHPRYEYAKSETVIPEVTARLLQLAEQAKRLSVGLTIDAEEASRLDLSLDIFERTFSSASLEGWEGLGLAVQSYQKRAILVLEWLVALSQRAHKRLPIRLIKGAYWDTEIKDTQVQGYADYPVFTRKTSTDLSFLACAQKMIMHPEVFYAQFATHNAYTIAAILQYMDSRKDFEFQKLHGMGEALYQQIAGPQKLDIPVRIYAPVGDYQSLLPYLVRRLLENGANSSFVHRITDPKITVDELVIDPIERIKALKHIPHPQLPLPVNLYQHAPSGWVRKNSKGLDLTDRQTLSKLRSKMLAWMGHSYMAQPTVWQLNHKVEWSSDESSCLETVTSPTDGKTLGTSVQTTLLDAQQALKYAVEAQSGWDLLGVEQRANRIERTAEFIEERLEQFLVLLIQEAGKTVIDALAEIREAIDFCRFYAAQARALWEPKPLVGPTGESNCLHLHGRGVIMCISPWNFPMAIFTGQVVAALVAGNTVLAKPAQPTPLIAAQIIALLHEAGVPSDVVQLLPGSGSMAGELLKDPRIVGVLFTGSTQTARIIQNTLAQRPSGEIAMLIAETGGQNAMIVDSSALPEQLVLDVMQSAFGSAGQRCSALRVLLLQEDIAESVITLLQGSMAQLQVGDPQWLSTDIGPVIDLKSRQLLQEHIDNLHTIGRNLAQVPLREELKQQGNFLAPQAFEIDRLSQLKHEVFGPILHVIRYRRSAIDQVIHDINATGYGLTLGIQSRIESFANYIIQRVRVGNIYVNRNITGAVVGVQPFGGEGLSGTGPKAGGPHYLLRLCQERTVTINTAAIGGNASLVASMEDDEIVSSN